MQARTLLFLSLLSLFSRGPCLAAAVEPPAGMVFVPAGSFAMGCNEGAYDEAPVHTVYLSAYYIDRTEVTNMRFADFVRRSGAVDRLEGPWFRHSTEGCLLVLEHYEARHGCPLSSVKRPDFPSEAAGLAFDADLLRWKAAEAALRVLLAGKPEPTDWSSASLRTLRQVTELIESERDMPVRNVSWRDAEAYASWAGKRLPTEAEWEKAARGTDGRLYPFGGRWDPRVCRAGLSLEAGPSPVTHQPGSASPYGCLDMAGNVWEYCSDWYDPAYYSRADNQRDPKGPEGLSGGRLPKQDPGAAQFSKNKQGRETDTRKVLRGGSWVGGTIGQAAFNNRATRRLWSNPGYYSFDTGFRCALSDEPAPVSLTQAPASQTTP